ncbi:MAG: septum site-determining protein Ssd [Propionibacteriaceae bacterium]
MTTAKTVSLLTRDEELSDIVLSSAAAAGVTVQLVSKVSSVSGLLFVGSDAIADVVEQGTPLRTQIVLIGEDPDELAYGSMSLNARVLVLPDGKPWLSQLLATSAMQTQGKVIGVVGGSGGVGTSTTAAGLAYSLRDQGRRIALVDADIGSGGLDLLLAAETARGWRWPALIHASGDVADLSESIIDLDGISLVSQARNGTTPPLTAVEAVVRSLSRSHEVVVMDLGRESKNMTSWCDYILMVVAGNVMSVAAASRAVDNMRSVLQGAAGLVVRQGAIHETEVAAAIGMPLVGKVVNDKGLLRGYNEGVAPSDCAGRLWRKNMTVIAHEVME